MEKLIVTLWLCSFVLWLCTAGLLLPNPRHDNQGVSPMANNTVERVSAKPLCDQLAELALEKEGIKQLALKKERTKDVFFGDYAFIHNYAFIDYIGIHTENLFGRGLNHGRVVAILHPRMSICKRMTRIIACLAFAMVTERALLFDWDEFPESFDDLFQPPLIVYSYSDAPALHNMIQHERSYKKTVDITVDMAFFHSLSDVHLNETYPEEVVYLHGDAWWAPPLFAVKVFSVSVLMDCTL